MADKHKPPMRHPSSIRTIIHRTAASAASPKSANAFLRLCSKYSLKMLRGNPRRGQSPSGRRRRQGTFLQSFSQHRPHLLAFGEIQLAKLQDGCLTSPSPRRNQCHISYGHAVSHDPGTDSHPAIICGPFLQARISTTNSSFEKRLMRPAKPRACLATRR